MNARTLKSIFCGLTLLIVLGGCSSTGSGFAGMFRSKTKVAFSNMTDSWLSVRFYVAEDAENPALAKSFLGGDAIKVQPGQTGHYSLRSNPNYNNSSMPVIHAEVTKVVASWEEAPTPYWMELLSAPPFTIVATGDSDHISFSSGDAALAMIPNKEIKRGNFKHAVATASEESTR